MKIEMQVVAASLDPEATLLLGSGLESGMVGSEISIQVVPRDGFGNVWSKGPATLEVRRPPASRAQITTLIDNILGAIEDNKTHYN
jgi:hypothetical protein